MPTGTFTQENVPQENLAIVVAGFKAQGAEVETNKQGDGKWTVVAKFPDE